MESGDFLSLATLVASDRNKINRHRQDLPYSSDAQRPVMRMFLELSSEVLWLDGWKGHWGMMSAGCGDERTRYD